MPCISAMELINITATSTVAADDEIEIGITTTLVLQILVVPAVIFTIYSTPIILNYESK